MKNIRFLTFVLAIATVILSACGAAAATPNAAPEAAVNTNAASMPVAFVGIVDSITGDQWVISGTTVTVDASMIRNGPFNVGDQVKVEGFVNPDGSFTVSKLETPAPKETATSPAFDDNSNDALINGNTNDTNVNDDNSNGANINDDNSNSANVNDDNSNSANVNDDNSNSTSSNDNSSSSNTNDDKGGGNSNDNQGGSSSNDNSSAGGGGNDNSSGGGNSNDG